MDIHKLLPRYGLVLWLAILVQLLAVDVFCTRLLHGICRYSNGGIAGWVADHHIEDILTHLLLHRLFLGSLPHQLCFYS